MRNQLCRCGSTVAGLASLALGLVACESKPKVEPATLVLNKGKIATTDGPFAETKEQLGGYTILETSNLDEAIAFAARNPLVLLGGHSIEIRPIRELGPPK